MLDQMIITFQQLIDQVFGGLEFELVQLFCSETRTLVETLEVCNTFKIKNDLIGNAFDLGNCCSSEGNTL